MTVPEPDFWLGERSAFLSLPRGWKARARRRPRAPALVLGEPTARTAVRVGVRPLGFGLNLSLIVLVLAGCRVPAQATFLQQHQREDGSWQDHQGRRITADNLPRVGSELRTTCLVLLAILGDGSTIRSGPFAEQAKAGMRWLLRETDARGQIALRTDPAWFTDQILASFTLAELARLSDSKALGRRLLAPTTWTLRYLERPRLDVTPEMLFWSRALLVALEGCGEKPWGAELRPLATRLATAVEHQTESLRASESAPELPAKSPPGVTPQAPPETDGASETALAFALYALVQSPAGGERSARITAAIDATLERCKDLGAIHPMAVAVHTMAIYQAGGRQWDTWSKRLTEQVVKTQLREEPAAHTWESSIDALGPLQTTAWHVLSIECYYRYCHLSLVSP